MKYFFAILQTAIVKSYHLFFFWVFFQAIFITPMLSQSEALPDTTQARLYLANADSLEQLRKAAEAIAFYQKAEPIFENVEDWENWLKVKQRIAFNYGKMGDLKKSLKTLDTAIMDGIKKVGETNYWIYYLKIDKSNVVQFMGRPAEGIAILEEILPEMIQQFGKYDEIIAEAYIFLGRSHYRSQAFDKSLDYKLKALEISQKIHGENHIDYAFYLKDVGSGLVKLQRYEEAIEFFEKSKNIRIAHYEDENHPSLAGSYTNLGICYTELGQRRKAEANFKQALQIEKSTYGSIHRKIASFLWNFGQFYFYEEKYEEAIKCYKEELSIRKQINDDLFNLASTYSRLGDAYLNNYQFEKSISIHQNALYWMSENLDTTDVYQTPSAKQIINPSFGIEYVYGKLTAIYWYLDYTKKQDEKAIKAGLELGELCLDLWRDLLYDLGQQNQTKERQSYFVKRNSIYASLIAAKQFEATGEKWYAQKAFYFAEQSKALMLQEAYLEADAKMFGQLPEVLANRENKLSQKIANFESQLLTAFQQGDAVQIAKIRNDSLFSARENYEKLVKEIEKNHPNYFDLKYSTASVSISEIQNQLADNQIFIEYLIHEKANTILVFLLEKNKEIQIKKIVLQDDITDNATKLNKLLQSYQLVRADRKKRFINLSHKLYQQFIQPIAENLKDKDQIIIVGEGITNYLPFEVLLPINEIKPFSELDFLVKTHKISYQYSGTLFVKSKEKTQNYSQDLLAFAPVFAEKEVSAIQNEGFRAEVDSTFRSVTDGNFEPLYHSEKEVKNIHQLFTEKGKKQNQLLVHKAANEANLKKSLNENYQFVHIASHSFANLKKPRFSGIACAQIKDKESKEDGICYVGEIYNLAVKSDLVVLSSCESGVGKLVSGEGMLGLNRSFVYAGVPNVVFSLWKVYDHIGSELMVNFYREVLDEKSYSTALRNAKLKMLEKEETASPEFWGAFLLIGE